MTHDSYVEFRRPCPQIKRLRMWPCLRVSAFSAAGAVVAAWGFLPRAWNMYHLALQRKGLLTGVLENQAFPVSLFSFLKIGINSVLCFLHFGLRRHRWLLWKGGEMGVENMPGGASGISKSTFPFFKG